MMDDQGAAPLDHERFGLASEPERYRVIVWDPWEACDAVEEFIADFGPELLDAVAIALAANDSPEKEREGALIYALHEVLKGCKDKLLLRSRCEKWLKSCMRLPGKNERFGEYGGGFVLQCKGKDSFQVFYRGRLRHILKLAIACFYTCAGDFFAGLEADLATLRAKKASEAPAPAVGLGE